MVHIYEELTVMFAKVCSIFVLLQGQLDQLHYKALVTFWWYNLQQNAGNKNEFPISEGMLTLKS